MVTKCFSALINLLLWSIVKLSLLDNSPSLTYIKLRQRHVNMVFSSSLELDKSLQMTLCTL